MKDLSREQEALQKFNRLFEMNPSMMALSTLPERRYVEVNQVFLTTLGLSREEVLGRTALELGILPNRSMLARSNELFQKDGRIRGMEMDICARDGKVRKGLFSGEIIEVHGNRYFLTVMMDISEQKAMEAQLREQEKDLRESLGQVELFRTLVESSGDCFYMVDLDDGCRMSYVNQAAARHFGTSVPEILTWHVPDWDPNFTLETLPGLIDTIVQIRRLQMESRHKRPDGSTVPVEITVNYLEHKDGHRMAYGWFSDISARLAAEEELREAKVLAESANRSKSEFLANMSHEIRTALNGVIGFTELLKNAPLDHVQQQYVDNANMAGRTLLGIINDILDFSKIEAGMLQLELIRTDMVQVFQNSVDLVKYAADSKNLELLLDLDPAMPRFALVDPVRLKQILANLLSNAVKFCEAGEIALQVRHVHGEDKMGVFRISVRDTGIGISSEQEEKLFKAFSQADSSTTRRFGGTGLGLVISDSIARKMGSTIVHSPAEGRGSIFSFDLRAQTLADESVEVPVQGGGKSVLIIDDNESSLLILSRLLGHWGFRTETARSGQEALGLVGVARSFDLIICDYKMPGMDGLETVRHLAQQRGPGTAMPPVLVLGTSNDGVDPGLISQEALISRVISKPVHGDTLRDFLSQSTPESPARDLGVQGEGACPGGLSILVAEDVPMNLLLVKAILKRMCPGLRVLEATDGAKAVEMYRSDSPDLVLMDVHMPVMDGLDASMAIRDTEKGTGRHVPIIALSAGVFKEEQDKCRAAGMDAFLTKPLDANSLKRLMEGFPLGKKG